MVVRKKEPTASFSKEQIVTVRKDFETNPHNPNQCIHRLNGVEVIIRGLGGCKIKLRTKDEFWKFELVADETYPDPKRAKMLANAGWVLCNCMLSATTVDLSKPSKDWD